MSGKQKYKRDSFTGKHGNFVEQIFKIIITLNKNVNNK